MRGGKDSGSAGWRGAARRGIAPHGVGRHAIARHLAAAALLLAAALSPAAAERPHRVVSLNLCTDQLLLALADRSDIASVSFLAADRELSALADRAVGLPANRHRLEEIVAARPDLVLIGRQASPIIEGALRRLGYPVLEVEIVPPDLATVKAQIAAVAEALGVPQRGAAIIADIDRRVAALRSAAPAQRPVAAIYQPSGYALGRGSLSDEILRLAGFDNLADRVGLRGYGPVPLEVLVAGDPDVLILDEDARDRRSLAQQMLDHPALDRQFPAERRIAVPRRLWICGGAFTLEAAELLHRHLAAGAREDGR